jgi:hypothetical protein
LRFGDSTFDNPKQYRSNARPLRARGVAWEQHSVDSPTDRFQNTTGHESPNGVEWIGPRVKYCLARFANQPGVMESCFTVLRISPGMAIRIAAPSDTAPCLLTPVPPDFAASIVKRESGRSMKIQPAVGGRFGK